MTSVNSRRPSVHKRLVTPLLWNGFSAITSLFFVVDRRIAFLESVNFCYVCLYANFQFSWWSRDHFLVPFRPNAWSQTLHTSKRHTFIVSAFHRYHWFGVKLFPFGSSKGTLKTPTLKIPEYFTIALVLTSTLTVCRQNRCDPSVVSVYGT